MNLIAIQTWPHSNKLTISHLFLKPHGEYTPSLFFTQAERSLIKLHKADGARPESKPRSGIRASGQCQVIKHPFQTKLEIMVIITVKADQKRNVTI